MKPIRIGTRGSMLAKWQAEFVRKKILEATGVDAEIVIIKTTGDKLQTASFFRSAAKASSSRNSKRLFSTRKSTRRSQRERYSHRSSVAPLLPAIYRREDTRDCLVSKKGESLLPSQRRAHRYQQSPPPSANSPCTRDLDVRELRGNVDTRLRKVASGEYDAILLAKAGLDRLGCDAVASAKFSRPTCACPLSVKAP